MTYKEWEYLKKYDDIRVAIMVAKDKMDYDEVRKLQQEMDKLEKTKCLN